MFVSNSLKMKNFVVLSAVLKVCETSFNVDMYIAWYVWKQRAEGMLIPDRQKWQRQEKNMIRSFMICAVQQPWWVWAHCAILYSASKRGSVADNNDDW